MNCLLANSFTTFFANLFANWQLVLFVVLTILLILAIFFKRFKIAFILFMLLAAAIGTTLLIIFVIDALEWDKYDWIDFAIAWGPTMLFSFIVVFSTLINALRGRRKSLILLAQSASAAVVWVLFFYFGVKSQKIDEALVNFVNLFLGEGGLQSSLGVSSGATTFKSIFALFLEAKSGEGTLGLLLSENPAYLYTLGDMLYHVVFGALCYLFYLLTVFILYLIYLCFYSERKHKRKKTLALSQNKTDEGYKKHRVGGGFVGLVRGIVVGLLGMSLIGGCFFMITGGRGEGTLRDYEVGGKYESQLKIYRSMESYGTQGIFMILNAMSDPNDMPYYLFAADLVFSGELNDERNGVSESVNLRKELGEFTGLARDTITLLLKYGKEQIAGAINGTSDMGIMASVLSVMRNREFQREFDHVIAQFDSPTYVYNFSMSLVSSVLANIDKMPFGASISDKNKELLKIMFKEGYLSEYIPEDVILHDLYASMNVADAWQADGGNVRPYFGMQQLINKEDVRLFTNIFLSILSDRSEGAGKFDMLRSITPKMKQLTLFKNGKNDALNPMFARMYCYLQNAYLKAEGADGYSYNALLGEKVDWTVEIDNLLDICEDYYLLHDDVAESSTAIFNRILYIFDQENPNREKDIDLYDGISEKLYVSRLMGKTLATSFFRQTLSEGLGQRFENIYIRGDTVYENLFDADGRVSDYGEFNYFLKGLRLIGCMEDQSLFDMLFGDTETESFSETLKTISIATEEVDSDGKNIAFYFARSDLFRAAISCFLIEEGKGSVYVPNRSREKDENGKLVNTIVGNELEEVILNSGLFAKFVELCSQGDFYGNIDTFLDDPVFMRLFETNGVTEGSVALLVKDRFASEEGERRKSIIVPRYLQDRTDEEEGEEQNGTIDATENWCSPVRGIEGEIVKFIRSYLMIRNGAGEEESKEEAEEGEEKPEAEAGEAEKTNYKLSLKKIMQGAQATKELIFTTVANFGMGETEEVRLKIHEKFFSSDIIHYTVSSYTETTEVNKLTVVVPVSSREARYDDEIDSVVKKSELCYMFARVKRLAIENNMDETKLLVQLIKNKDLIEGEVLSASVVNNLVTNGKFCHALKLNETTTENYPDFTYAYVGERIYLVKNQYGANPWKKELPLLLDALKILFEDKMEEEGFVFNRDAIIGALSEASGNLLILQVCRASHVVSSAFAEYLVAPAPLPEPEPESDEEP